MAGRRARVLTGGVALLIVALFAGHWGAEVLSDQWWAAAVDPAAAPFLFRWHLLGLLLELAGMLVAVLWCIGHLLFVVGSISSVQVPRRLGDLEIREVLPNDRLRSGAMVAGGVLGVFVGSGAGRLLPLVLQAWRGVHYGVADPLLGLDVGIYLAQLPLWDAGLEFCGRLVWVALGGAALCHLLVGGARVSRHGVAMTDAARVQLGLLVALALALGALGEGLGPLRAVAGLETGTLAAHAPSTRWIVAGIWGASAIAMALWTARPSSGLVLAALGLWLGSGLLSRVWTPGTSLADRVPLARMHAVAALATGVDQVVDAPGTSGGHLDRVQPGLWDRPMLLLLTKASRGADLLAVAPFLAHVGGEEVPAWLGLRDDSAGRSLFLVADDRLGPGGGPVSFRDGDPVAYPGLVTWRSTPNLAIAPGAPDSVVRDQLGAIPLQGVLRRLTLAWASQAIAPMTAIPRDAALWWRRAPRERVAALFPPAWWDEPRPLIRDGRLVWVVDGWFLADGAAFAPPIPWEGGPVRYARPGLLALVDGETGTVRLFARPDADSLVRAWVGIAGDLILPRDSIPSGLVEASPSERWLAVAARALEAGNELPRPAIAWGPRGPVPETSLDSLVSGHLPAERLRGLLFGAPGVAVVRASWPEGDGPLTAHALATRWGRFATLERLDDSIRSSGGKLEAGEVRYDVTPVANQAVRIRWAISANGAPTVAWVEVAEGDRLGAARTPASAVANLRGESAPLVPAPDLPDPLAEARRWAARADSLLRVGDLEGFGRAFGALKRVLGTP